MACSFFEFWYCVFVCFCWCVCSFALCAFSLQSYKKYLIFANIFILFFFQSCHEFFGVKPVVDSFSQCRRGGDTSDLVLFTMFVIVACSFFEMLVFRPVLISLCSNDYCKQFSFVIYLYCSLFLF